MHQSRGKKIFIYFFLFIIIGTLNNKNLSKISLTKINNIEVTGLSNKINDELINHLAFLKTGSMFFIKKNEITKIMNSYPLVEEYLVFKKYPSTLDIKIKKTEFLAQLRRNNGQFLLGSNGKFIQINEFNFELPFIFGDFKTKNFFELKEAIDQTSFDYNQIKKLFFFKSGRWDIETKNGLLIRLPKDKINISLKMLINFLDQNKEKKLKEIDLRQHKQIIING